MSRKFGLPMNGMVSVCLVCKSYLHYGDLMGMYTSVCIFSFDILEELSSMPVCVSSR